MAPPLLLRRLTVLAVLLTFAACGSSEDVELEVAGPLASAEVRSYTGWFPGPWQQEIWIRLAEGVELSEVARLSVFGKLRPGMSLTEAMAVAGPPARQSMDLRGTKWGHWPSGGASVQIGCHVSCSGDDCYSNWDLRAQGSGLSAEEIFIPAIVEVVRKAEASKPEVEHRAVHVDTHGYTEKLTLTLLSDWDKGLWWGGQHAPCGTPTGTSAPAPAVSGG